jgi:hypothetical protein
MVIVLVVLVGIILMGIGEYFISAHWWLFHSKALVVILLMVINSYYTISYCWLLLQLLMIIVLQIIVGYSML